MGKKEIYLANFGKHLKKVRKDMGVSQRELELRCDIDRHFLSKIENGKINPGLFTIKQLAEAMDLTTEEFFKGFKL